jgi:hypothetical protein
MHRASPLAEGESSRTERRECARSPWLRWSLSVLSTVGLNACRSGLDCSVVPRQKPLDCRVLHLPDMDFRNSANSNFSSNIVSEFGSTNFVECLVRLQTEPADDDSFWISVVPPKIDCGRPSPG